jgi:hypothetical protein
MPGDAIRNRFYGYFGALVQASARENKTSGGRIWRGWKIESFGRCPEIGATSACSAPVQPWCRPSSSASRSWGLRLRLRGARAIPVPRGFRLCVQSTIRRSSVPSTRCPREKRGDQMQVRRAVVECWCCVEAKNRKMRENAQSWHGRNASRDSGESRNSFWISLDWIQQPAVKKKRAMSKITFARSVTPLASRAVSSPPTAMPKRSAWTSGTRETFEAHRL